MYIFISIILFFAIIVGVSLSIFVIDEKTLEVIVQVITILCSSGLALTINKTINIKQKNSNAIRDINGDSNTNYQAQQMTVYNGNNKELINALTELKGTIENKEKINQENIVIDVVNQLKDAAPNCIAPNEEFVNRYLIEAKNISDREIQKIWSDLFICEAQNNNTITLRTLDILKNLSKEEAQSFRGLSNFIYTEGNIGYLFKDAFTSLNLLNITKLMDIGLIKSEVTLTWNPIIDQNGMILKNDSIFLIMKSISSKPETLRIPVFVLTDAGVQLMKALKLNINDASLIDVGNHFKKKYKTIDIKAHRIINMMPNGQIHHEINDLLV